jgi:peptidoglycan/xylan/chitin deacetylase (PgdA/CDA1 family)
MTVLLAVLLAFPVVVMYHRVDFSAPADAISQRLTITPGQLADELRSIRRMGLHTVGIAELARDVALHRLPQRAVLLTFDDGYSDQFRYAFAILERFGDRATFFVNTATIGAPGHLSWREVETMARAGMSIECHGVDHVALANLTLAAQSYQIVHCVSELAGHLKQPILAYAYPSGSFDADTVVIERQAGVLFGFTTDPRFQLDARSPYEIARIRVMSGMTDVRFAELLQRPLAYVEFPDPVPQANRRVP